MHRGTTPTRMQSLTRPLATEAVPESSTVAFVGRLLAPLLVVALGIYCFCRARRRTGRVRVKRSTQYAKRHAKRRVVLESDSESDDDDEQVVLVPPARSCFCRPCFESLITACCGVSGPCACMMRTYCLCVRWACLSLTALIIALAVYAWQRKPAADMLPPNVNPAIVEWQRLYQLHQRH